MAVNNTGSTLILCVDRKHRRIPIRGIRYLQSRGRQIILHTDAEALLFYGKLNDIQPLLPEHLFWRCHQSYLVNIDCVAAVGTQLQLADGAQIPVRSRRRSALYEEFYKKAVRRSLETGLQSPALLRMEEQWPKA